MSDQMKYKDGPAHEINPRSHAKPFYNPRELDNASVPMFADRRANPLPRLSRENLARLFEMMSASFVPLIASAPFEGWRKASLAL